MVGIYILEFSNGDFYIGRSVNINQRMRSHRYNLKNNIHKNKHLQNVYNKYGDFQYKLLEETSKDLQGEREIYWIKKLSPPLNLTEGGDGGEILTEEEKIRRKKDVYNDEYRKKMSDRMIGKKVRVDVGEKISQSRKKLYENPEKKKWLIEHSGIHNSKGYLNQKKGSDSPNAKKVINLDTGEIYGCLKDVAKKYNRNYASLISILNEYRRPNKSPFRYLDN